jgi:hypothetical protein
MGEGCQEAEYQAETVEERGWAAYHILGGEFHGVANKAGIVEEVARKC